MAHRRRFPNSGAIKTGNGGFVGLIGGSVANSGTIDAPLGKIGLGSGEQATLDLTGDGFLQVAIPTAAGGAGALIDVAGKIQAAGGRIEIKAATAQQAIRNAVNISGSLSASSVHASGGAIVLDGGGGGQTNVSGQIGAPPARGGAARSRSAAGRSRSMARKLSVSGTAGGGRVTIGGGAHGASVAGITTSDTVSIDAATTISAGATQ